VDHEIILDHATKRSRGFGFIVFDNEKVVDDILANGNMIDMNGARVSLARWLLLRVTQNSGSTILNSTKRHCISSYCNVDRITRSRLLVLMSKVSLASVWYFSFDCLSLMDIITGLISFCSLAHRY